MNEFPVFTNNNIKRLVILVNNNAAKWRDAISRYPAAVGTHNIH